MTNSIQGVGSGSIRPQFTQLSMSESQKTSFQEIISKYDVDNFSKTDFETMGKEFRQAGIRPTREVKSMLEMNGFNVEQYIKGGPGGPQGPRPMGGPGGPPKPKDMQEGLQQLLTISEETGDSELQSIVEDMLTKSEEDAVTEKDEEKLRTYLQQNVPLIGFYMDTKV